MRHAAQGGHKPLKRMRRRVPERLPCGSRPGDPGMPRPRRLGKPGQRHHGVPRNQHLRQRRHTRGLQGTLFQTVGSRTPVRPPQEQAPDGGVQRRHQHQRGAGVLHQRPLRQPRLAREAAGGPGDREKRGPGQRLPLPGEPVLHLRKAQGNPRPVFMPPRRCQPDRQAL